MCTWWLRWPEEELQRSSWPTRGNWELTLGLLQDKEAFLKARPSLQPCKMLVLQKSLMFSKSFSFFEGISGVTHRAAIKLCLALLYAHQKTVVCQLNRAERVLIICTEVRKGGAACDSGHWTAFLCWSRAFLTPFGRVSFHQPHFVTSDTFGMPFSPALRFSWWEVKGDRIKPSVKKKKAILLQDFVLSWPWAKLSVLF